MTTKSGPGVSSLTLCYGTTGIRVAAPDRADLEWLGEFLHPAFQLRSDLPARFSVQLQVDPGRWRRIYASGPMGSGRRSAVFALDSRMIRHQEWRITQQSRAYFDNRLEVFYLFNPERTGVSILAATKALRLRVALMRVVREFAMARQFQPDRIVVHAALVGIRRGGILLCGPKRAGKTTLLLHALTSAGTRLGANDRAVVVPGPGDIRCFPMPSIVSLRAGSLEFFPDFSRKLAEADPFYRLTLKEVASGLKDPDRNPESDVVGISPAQLARLADVPMMDGAPLRAVVFPVVRPRRRGIELHLLSRSEAASNLKTSLFRAGRARKVAAPFAGFAQTAGPNLNEMVGGPLAGVDFFRCTLGPDAYSQNAQQWIDRVAR